MLAEGETYSSIQAALACDRGYISRWKERFMEERLAGLHARHTGRAVSVQTPQMEARILSWTRRKPTDGSTHWTTRKLAKKLGVSHQVRTAPSLVLPFPVGLHPSLKTCDEEPAVE